MNNLNNLSDEELDKLFRQSAEERDVEFDERAWQKMNALLDENQPLSSNWRKYSLMILAVLFLGSTAVYFGNKNGLFNSFQNGKFENSKSVISELETGKSRISESDISELESGISGNIDLENNKTEKGSDEDGRGEASGPPKQLNNNKTKLKNTNDGVNSDLEISKLENNSEKDKNPIAVNEKNNNSTKTKNLNVESKLSYKAEKINNSKKANFESITNSELNISANKSQPINLPKTISKQNEKLVGKGEFENENISDKNSISPKIKNSEIAESSRKSYFKTKNIKTVNGKNNINLDNNIGVENPKLAKNTIKKKNDIFKPEGMAVDEEEEKVNLQNISLKYLSPKTTYNYKKPSFVVNVIPLELDLPEPKKTEYFKKGLAIRFAVSPDISTISDNKISKIGSNIGGLLEYRFSDKLSIQAGVFRSMKYYNAMPDQYAWAWGYSHDKLKNINAQCEMMDYPVNIRYDFLAKGTTRIFVGVGATTYKMMNEKYNYNYVNNYSPTIMHREWNGNTGTYYTSNLNLSIGLEKYISKYFTMQVEPFAKTPLKNVGFGKVPLITYGMMISGKMPLNSIIKK